MPSSLCETAGLVMNIDGLCPTRREWDSQGALVIHGEEENIYFLLFGSSQDISLFYFFTLVKTYISREIKPPLNFHVWSVMLWYDS